MLHINVAASKGQANLVGLKKNKKATKVIN